jgi:hypothetical protein
LDFPKVAWVDSKKKKYSTRTRVARKNSNWRRRKDLAPQLGSGNDSSYRQPLPNNGNGGGYRRQLNQGYLRNSTGDAAYPRGSTGDDQNH